MTSELLHKWHHKVNPNPSWPPVFPSPDMFAPTDLASASNTAAGSREALANPHPRHAEEDGSFHTTAHTYVDVAVRAIIAVTKHHDKAT